MSKIININNYTIKKDDKFIVDTNIWIYITNAYSMATNKNIEKSYSDFINKVLDNGAEIGILSLGISELFNLYLKEGFKNFREFNKGTSFKKDYRPSSNFQKDKNFIINTIKESILTIAKPISDTFDLIEPNLLLDKRMQEFDFNDSYFYYFCKKNGYKLISHDKDYKNYKGDVLILKG